MVDHVVECFCIHPLRFGKEVHEAGVDVSRAGAHGDTSGGRERHGRINAAPAVHCREACTVAQVSENQPAAGRLRSE